MTDRDTVETVHAGRIDVETAGLGVRIIAMRMSLDVAAQDCVTDVRVAAQEYAADHGCARRTHVEVVATVCTRWRKGSRAPILRFGLIRDAVRPAAIAAASPRYSARFGCNAGRALKARTPVGMLSRCLIIGDVPSIDDGAKLLRAPRLDVRPAESRAERSSSRAAAGERGFFSTTVPGSTAGVRFA